MRGVVRWSVTVMVALSALAVLTPAAGASIATPAVTLTPSTGTAGSTANLGVDIKFSPSSGDTVKDLELKLPPGLIANAAINGGACLKTSTPTPACQVGSGTVTASANVLGIGVPVTLNAAFDLVAPPAGGDLAGLAAMVNAPVTNTPTQLGTPGAVTLRSQSDPAGVGLNIAFTNLPTTFDGLSISLDEINSTFAGLRFPSTCPATPAPLAVSADSYADPTVRTGSAPLRVTGCASEPYAPALKVDVSANSTGEAQVITQVTQAANQATTGKLTLLLPFAELEPDVESVLRFGLLCTDPTYARCRAVGSATATSPLYPTPLTGTAYLTGQLLLPNVTIVFPPPFALTLNGAVNLAKITTTFTGIPDIPLTNLTVTLFGGSGAAFMATCAPPSGTAVATLTDQNGDRTVQASSPFTVSGCSAQAGSPPSAGGGSPASGGSAGGSSPARIGTAWIAGLAAGKPQLGFSLFAAGGHKLTSVTVPAPRSLRFRTHRVHGHVQVRGLALAGATKRSATVRGGRLVITLRHPVSALIVGVTTQALAESAATRTRARHHRLGRLTLKVLVRDTRGQQTTLTHALRVITRAPK